MEINETRLSRCSGAVAFELTVTVIACIQTEHLNQAKTQHTGLRGWRWA